ncbi:MAG: D-3-phosphoglycerate dehydrogenase [uncultured Thermomicrobiales bacterium]|uniref:D-3-phosphoglycerate dehydrogenase n=1 Tax=uncultured Thermomicrobiales bacterium TaxID=1645740 RepID=A0A6J4UNQ4_9BACT|nr:MAG: D-3-phosphoglycerate dehydrogenase [uncultured Thermomicrobiales bacterium]
MAAGPGQPLDRAGAGDRPTVLIASPLEEHHAARIAGAFAGRVDTVYRPDLLPPIRFPGDHGGSPGWRRSPEQQREWHAALRRAEVLWDFPLGESEPLLELAPRLRWVQTTSAGVGQYVQRLGLADSDLLVTTASGVHAQPLTEFVFAALLHHTKRVGHLQDEQRAHRWERFCARELDGQTMAIVGPGRIGRKVAQVARCFGMTVWAMARAHDPDRAAALGVDRLFARGDFHAMLAGADCVVLCAPHTPETDNLLDREAIAILKPGVVLVNIARGAVVDEDALVEALRAGRIGLAALDVFRAEPLPPTSPFWDLPNVLVCPHSASTADTENAKLTDRFVRNLGFYLDGRLDRMEPALDKARLY